MGAPFTLPVAAENADVRRELEALIAEADAVAAERAAAEARERHMRRELERAAEFGADLLAALDLSRLVTADFVSLNPVAIGDAVDLAIVALDAIEVAPDFEDGHDAEHDTADAEEDLGWTACVSQAHLGFNTPDGDATVLERHGCGFVRSGPDDAEDSDPPEDDGTGEPDLGAWESRGPHDQSRWCAMVTPSSIYAMRVSGDCCAPVIPDGSRCIVDGEAAFGPGDFVVIHHDDPSAEGGIASKVKQLADELLYMTLPLISEVELLPVISVRMLNPRRGIFYDSAMVHAIHKVVSIERA